MAAVVGTLPSAAESWLERLVSTLRDEPLAWPQALRPLRLVDGGASTAQLLAELQSAGERIDLLVWLGVGFGWDETNAASLSSLVKSLAPRPPRVVALVLKYGARYHAERLLVGMGVEMVLWLQAPSLDEPTRLLLDVLVPSLTLALTAPFDRSAVEEQRSGHRR